MKVYVIINGAVVVALVLFCTYLYYQQKKAERQQIADNKVNEPKFDWKIIWLIIIAGFLVLFSIISPLLFTTNAINADFDFTKTGQIGDTIGGLMNPFITLAGVVVTGLAFYIQYRANRQQLELFHKEQEANKLQLQAQIDSQKHENRIQQFESQFYEMLRLHRENVTEMEIEGYNFKEPIRSTIEKYEKITKGRKAFVVMKTEFECVLAAYAANSPLDSPTFLKCYKLFFSGLEDFKRAYPGETVMSDLFSAARKKHEEPYSLNTPVTTNADRKKFITGVNLYFNYKPFSGHASRLGHYFRHLYFTVKSVANSDIITDYTDRMKYLRILRAQLSNHEQMLLFYNWLGGHGEPWENETHRFFTEYSMIHNLWYDNLFQDPFILDTVNRLRNKPVKERQGAMFEIDT